MSLDGNLGNTGVPKRIAIPVGVVGAVGAFIFVKRFRAAKTSKSAPSAPATSTGSLASSTPYGPNNGDPDINMATTNSGFGQGQYAAMGNTVNGVVGQNQAIMAALAQTTDMEISQSKILASLLAVNPGAMAQYKQLPPNSEYQKAMQSQMTANIAGIYPGMSGVPGGM